MKIAYYVIGLLFLLNPNYGIIDVLPDAIGYILILKAIERVADLYEYVADAKKILLRLAIISIAKLGATVLCNVTDDTFVLVLTFVFVIVELIYVIPAFIKLYNGIGYSAMRLGVPGISERTPAIRNLTVVFFVCRGILALTPELSSLLYSINRLLANSDYPATLKRNLSYICMPLLLVYILLNVIVIAVSTAYDAMAKRHHSKVAPALERLSKKPLRLWAKPGVNSRAADSPRIRPTDRIQPVMTPSMQLGRTTVRITRHLPAPRPKAPSR